MLKYGVIGYGYWGPNLVRVFNAARGSSVKRVADLSVDNLNKVNSTYPTIEITTDYRDLIDDADIDVIVVATPIETHFTFAMEALKAGKHVYIEKPMAATAGDAEKLLEEAARRDLLIFVDHTFIYTGAVRKIHELMDSGKIGDFLYYDSVRINLGLFQSDVNVVWDLAVHDISILDHIIPQKPQAVSCQAISIIKNQPESLAYLTLYYADNKLAHIHVSWLSPIKIRQTLIGGSKQMIVYNDLELSEKIKIYDKSVELVTDPDEVTRLRVGYRSGDMLAPNLDGTEALSQIADHFNDCVTTGRQPITNGETGTRIVQILESAMLSAARKGEVVALEF